MATSTAAVTEVGALTTEKVTYRKYVKLDTDEKGNTIVKEKKLQAEAQAKVPADSKDYPDSIGISVNWAKLEKEGYTLFSENEFTRYTVKSEDGFASLVPDEAQRVYIIQSGLNYLQNAKANGLMDETEENNPVPTPSYQQATIDLRDAINEPPTRKSLTDMEKLERTIASLNLSPEQTADLLMTLAKAQSEKE